MHRNTGASSEGWKVANYAEVSLTIDNTAPDVPELTSPADGLIIKPSAAILNWTDETDTNGPVTYRYKSSWSGGNYGPVSTGTISQINASGSSSRVYNWQVQACDSLGNCSAWSGPWEVTIDGTNPTNPGTPVSTVTSPTNQTTITWNWTAATDVLSGIKDYLWNLWKGVTLKLSGTTTNTYQSIDLSSYGDGDFTFDVRSEDNASNVSGVSTSAATTVDTVVPATPGNPNPEDQSYKNTHNFTFSWDTISDPSTPVTYEWESSYGTTTKVDGSFTSRLAFHSLSSAFVNSPGTPNNTYYWHVRAIDAAGNKSAWSNPWKVVVDTVAPTGTITYSTTTLTNGNVVATLVPSETVIVTNNGGSTNYTFTANGTFTFNFRDLAGNTGSATAIVSNIDKTAPSITNVLADKEYVKSGDVITITANVTDANGIAAVSADFSYNSSYTSRPSPTSVGMTNIGGNTYRTLYTIPSSWNEGQMYIKVAARDGTGGNWIRSSEFDVVTVDNTAPNFVSKTSFSGWYKTEQTSTFDYTDANGVVLGTPVTCVIGTEGLDQTCSVTPNVCDAAGNCNTTPIISNRVNIDMTKPDSTITEPLNSGPGSTIYINIWNGSIKGTATDSLSGINGVKVSIKNAAGDYYDGTTFTTSGTEILLNTTYSEGNWEYSGLTSPVADSYTITSHAIDNANNMENSYKLTVILDKTIPEVAISLNPTVGDASNGWYKTQPEVTLTATDAHIDKIEYQWNSETGTWTAYSSPFKPGSEGSNVLYYRAQDKAGNYSGVGIKNIKWDQTELTEGPLNVSVSPNPTSETTSVVKWEEAKDNIGIDRYEIKWSLKNGDKSYSDSVGSNIREHEINNLIEGDWTIEVKAFDWSGKSKSASIDLTVDRTGPAAPILSILGTTAGSVLLSWSKIDEANNYIIWYGTNPGSYQYGAKVGDTQGYTVQGLGAGSYYFIVKAMDPSGNQSGNSNEVSTGTIIGAPGVTENTPAEGFAENVLGETTESAKLTPTGSVLGTENENGKKKILWWQWVLLLLLPTGAWFGYRKWKNKNN